jgi:5'(3')-deoxyribonucleotidase
MHHNGFSTMQRIAVDMDEVMADTMSHYLERYNAEFGQTLTAKDFHGRGALDVIDVAHRDRAREYFHQEEFFANIPVMPGSQEVIRELARRYDVFITTAAMDVPCSFSAKFFWLQEHFPFILTRNIVFCGDKSIIAAEYMIDDNVRHLRSFRGEGILYTAPHNVYERAFRRVDNWEDVRRMFLGH